MLTAFDLSLIYWNVKPDADEAFDRLARDHGRSFAENIREELLTRKELDMLHEYANSPNARLGGSSDAPPAP